jgi:hypothetical protein
MSNFGAGLEIHDGGVGYVVDVHAHYGVDEGVPKEHADVNFSVGGFEE